MEDIAVISVGFISVQVFKRVDLVAKISANALENSAEAIVVGFGNFLRVPSEGVGISSGTGLRSVRTVAGGLDAYSISVVEGRVRREGICSEAILIINVRLSVSLSSSRGR